MAEPETIPVDLTDKEMEIARSLLLSFDYTGENMPLFQKLRTGKTKNLTEDELIARDLSIKLDIGRRTLSRSAE